MRIRLAVILCIMFILSGCKGKDDTLDTALAMRNKVSRASSCSFCTVVTADYGEQIYIFKMDCQTDKDGNLSFSVIEPATIAGISGKITGTGGAILFDDKVLAFPTIADGQITPVTAPWLFMKTLRSGYMKDTGAIEDGIEISIDDSYEAECFQLRIRTKGESPVSAEIFWKNRRVLTLSVENFRTV